MSILINIPNRPVEKIVARLAQSIDKRDIQVWPNITAPEQVKFALVWKQQAGSLTHLPNLQGISSFGAGVDSILADPQLPAVPIARIVDPNLSRDMAGYVLTVIQQHLLRFAQFQQQQVDALWKPKSARKGKRVGILGFGQLGQACAALLQQMGFTVSAWASTEKTVNDIACKTGRAGFESVVAESDFLVCLLPLTEQTENILNLEVFKLMPKDAAIINVARGHHLVDDDLIAALDQGEIAFAYLDVFRQEPLPKDHDFWQHKQIQITPHISAVTNLETALEQVIENYHRVQAGLTMLNCIDQQRGY